jgi:exoribonuclease R
MQSIYSPYGNYNLYSDDIISDISLRKGEIREVISISFLVDRDYKIISHEILKNKIKITNNYSYKEIDSFIEKDEIFKNLQKFTTKHRQDRVNNADFEQFNKDISLHLNDNNLLELKV